MALIKKVDKDNKKEVSKFAYVKIHKDNVIATNKESILIQTPKSSVLDDLIIKFWVKKAFVFGDTFTNLLTVSLKDDFKYNVFNGDRKNIDWKTPDEIVTGKEFKEILLEIFKSYNEKE